MSAQHKPIRLADVLDSKTVGLKLTQNFRLIFMKYMRIKRISMAELSRKINKTRANVTEMFSCNHAWNLNTIVTLCDALELDIRFEISERLVK